MFSKKETTKVFAVMLLSVFMFSLIAGVLVAGQETSAAQAASDAASKVTEKAKTIGDKISAKLGGSFTGAGDIFNEATRTNIARILLIFLLVLLVYSIATFLPFFPENQDYIRWFVAIAVAILAFLFVDASDVRAITTNYEALGIVLTSIIPFIIILTFTYKIRDKYPAYASIVNKVILAGFVIILLYRWWILPETAKLPWLYLATALATLIWVVIEKKVWKYGEEQRIQGVIDSATMFTDTEKAAKIVQLREQADVMEEFDSKLADRLREAAKRLEKSSGK